MYKKVLKKFLKSTKKENRKSLDSKKERELLEKKVLKGTDFALREYGEVFKKLAEYDQI